MGFADQAYACYRYTTAPWGPRVFYLGFVWMLDTVLKTLAPSSSSLCPPLPSRFFAPL